MIKKIKQNLIGFILGAIIFSIIGVYATTLLASQVPYTNNNQENVQGAIDDLYDKMKNHCPDKKLCINKTELLEKNPVCYSNQNIETTKKCKRATFLHTETCSQVDTTRYCSGAGYLENGSKGTTTMIYGNCGEIGTLASGDAFDCDINGDGIYDEETERFYYVSDYYNTETKQFEDDTAVLIYYSNTSEGIINNSTTYAYHSGNKIYEGPVTAVKQLPTTVQWPNVSLKNINRYILNNSNQNIKTIGDLPENAVFNYNGYAARFLTYNEVIKACGTIGVFEEGYLDNCSYFMENTSFSNNNMKAAYWLETAHFGYSNAVIRNVFTKRLLASSYIDHDTSSGVRPAIEVSINDIQY